MNILITGAGSGIGKSLAEYYATHGNVLLLMGRNLDNLTSVQTICRNKGADVYIKSIDVTDRTSMEEVLKEWEEKHPIDLVIANAGVRSIQENPDREEIDRLLQTNLYGVLNTVLPLIEPMKKRKSGHIAVISSLAAYRTFPYRGAYTASKAAVKMFCEGWRVELSSYGIAVSTVYPGFVETPLTAHKDHPMPFIISAEESAKRIAAGLKKKKANIAFPLPVFLIMRLLQSLPDQLVAYIMKKVIKIN